MELRTNPDLSIKARDASADKADYLDGYAAVFNKRTRIWWFWEEMAEGAFTRALSENQDVRTLFNHDPNYPLARTKNGTLVLRQDSNGLWTESKLSKNPTSDSILDHVRTGLVSGMSFAFTVKRQEWVFDDEDPDNDLRIITEIGVLYDVGPVTYPAYEQTSVKVREAAKKLHDEARSRWNDKRSTFQVPAGFDLICREARGAEPEDVWSADSQDHEFREKLRSVDPDETEAKPDEEKPSEKPAEGQGEKTPETPSEEQGDGGTKSEGTEAVPAQEGGIDPIIEASRREIELKRKKHAVSVSTRRCA